MNSSFLVVEEVMGYDVVINLDKVAYINPIEKTVYLDYAGGTNGGLVYLSEQGMNTLKYRIYSDIGRSRNE